MKKMLSVILAFVMLFTLFAHAEDGRGSITISEAIYSDGVNEYDFTGMSVKIDAAESVMLRQLIMNLITASGQTSAVLETDGEKAYLYADGFSAAYQVDFEDVFTRIAQSENASLIRTVTLLTELFSGNDAAHAKADAGKGLAESLYSLYDAIIGDANQIRIAKTGTVSTFIQETMTAYVVPIEYDEEMLDSLLKGAASGLDANGFFDAVKTLLGVAFCLPENEEGKQPETMREVYEAFAEPLALSIHGNTYYGENDIFVNASLYSQGVEILPFYFEITNTAYPVMYMNIPFQTEEGNVVLYITAEASADCTQEYFEFGILQNENTIALLRYQKSPNEEETMPVYDVYVGAASADYVSEISVLYETDDRTVRNLLADLNVLGVQFQAEYIGAILTGDASVSEKGEISVSSNIGIKFKAKLELESGMAEVKNVIEDTDSALDVFSDKELLLNDVMAACMKAQSILKGNPSFARLFPEPEAEG